jgi:hypothetical protein
MNSLNTDRRFVATCFGLGLTAAITGWAIGLNEWQAWLTAAILAVALCTLYTVRVILPHARPRSPRKPSEGPQPASR